MLMMVCGILLPALVDSWCDRIEARYSVDRVILVMGLVCRIVLSKNSRPLSNDHAMGASLLMMVRAIVHSSGTWWIS